MSGGGKGGSLVDGKLKGSIKPVKAAYKKGSDVPKLRKHLSDSIRCQTLLLECLLKGVRT